jgi:hypothetical protein
MIVETRDRRPVLTAPSCQETYPILGQLGKVLFLMKRLFFISFVALAASGCNNELADKLQSGSVTRMFGIGGRWAGPVTPETDGCGKTATGLMTVAGNTFAFDPFQGTTVIGGTLAGTALQGTLSRPGGNGQQTVSITFNGTAKEDDGEEETIDGRLVSGHCSWTVKLKRA